MRPSSFHRPFEYRRPSLREICLLSRLDSIVPAIFCKSRELFECWELDNKYLFAGLNRRKRGRLRTRTSMRLLPTLGISFIASLMSPRPPGGEQAAGSIAEARFFLLSIAFRAGLGGPSRFSSLASRVSWRPRWRARVRVCGYTRVGRILPVPMGHYLGQRRSQVGLDDDSWLRVQLDGEFQSSRRYLHQPRAGSRC